MDFLTLGLFVLALFMCVLTGASILYALLAGYVLFFCYGLYKGLSAPELFRLTLKGILTVKNILMVFVLIGMITALWRACGTLPLIITLSGDVMSPGLFLVLTFLLNCLVSILTGTSFGTSATIGIICMSIGRVMGLSPVYLGGAILGGSFFGDRCSPMSTSALLVAALTHTDIFINIRLMVKEAIVPFVATCAIYFFLGWGGGAAQPDLKVFELFRQNFNLHYITLLPAILIILLSLFKLSVKLTMSISIIISAVLALTVQNLAPAALAQMLLTGYHSPEPALAPMLNGGGILSMARAGAIIALSSSYSGIFEGTGLLLGVQKKITALAKHGGVFGCSLFISVLTGMIACNQTLASILQYQLCDHIFPDKQEEALTLENTVILTSALIPWSIASAVPLSAVGAPPLAIAAACYLYLQPLWSLWCHGRQHSRGEAKA